jgi:mono/diheme cytochrome c family protein
MKSSRALLALGLLVAGLLAAARTTDGSTSPAPAPAPALAGDAASGERTFTAYCSVCHAVGARGFIGPKIGGINWTTPGLHAIVRGGVGGYGSMPAFNADAVSDQKIADIAAYLASLAPPTAPPASPAAVAIAAAATPPSAPTIAAPAIATPAITVAATPGPDAVHGRQVYTANCAACHGANAQGGVGPSLRGEKSRKNTAAAIAWIKNPLLPMPKLYPAVLSEKDVEDVAAYVESL